MWSINPAFGPARTALAAMEADFPDDVLTQTARTYFAVVAGEDTRPVSATPQQAMVAPVASASASGFALHAAYPNPFNPQAVIPFSVNEVAQVELRVFDMLGREVMALVNGRYQAGVYHTTLDGSQLASGMYMVKATVQPETSGAVQTYTQRLTLLK